MAAQQTTYDAEPVRPDHPTRPPAAPWGPREILVAVGVAALALLAILAGVSVIAGPVDLAVGTVKAEPARVIALVLAQIAIDGVAVGAAWFLSLYRYRLDTAAWGLRRARPLAVGRCAAALAGAFAILGVYAGVTRALGWEGLEPKENVPEALFAHRTVVPFTVLLVVLVAPLAEELFFRAFVFGGLRTVRRAGVSARGRRARVVGAAVVSGLLWAAIHGQAGLVVPIGGIGVLFALLYEGTGSLWNPIAVHMAFNLVGVLGQLVSHGGGS